MRRTNDFMLAYAWTWFPGTQSTAQKPDADFPWGRLEQLHAHLPCELYAWAVWVIGTELHHCFITGEVRKKGSHFCGHIKRWKITAICLIIIY